MDKSLEQARDTKDRVSRQSPSSPETSGSNAGRVKILLAFCILLLVIFLRLLTLDPQIQAWMYRWTHPATSSSLFDFSAQMQRDPEIGLTLPGTSAAKDLRKAARATKKGYLLVNVGECSSCMNTDFKKWNADAKARGLQMLLFTTANKKMAANFLKEAHLGPLPIVTDRDRNLIAALNAFVAPRAYLFSRDWKLLWKQDELGQARYNLFKNPRLIAELETKDAH